MISGDFNLEWKDLEEGKLPDSAGKEALNNYRALRKRKYVFNDLTISHACKKIRTDAGLFQEKKTLYLIMKGLSELNGSNQVDGIAMILEAAEQGDKKAQYLAALVYINNYNNELKYQTKAISYLEKSAAQHYAPAQNTLGYCYMKGLGVTRDAKKAFEYFQFAAQQKNTQALYNIGLCYDQGIGVRRNFDEALKNYRFAIDQGNIPALNNLAICYQQGYTGLPKLDEALRYYTKAANEHGDAAAQNNLGVLYETGVKKDEFNDYELKQDLKQAIEYYQLSASQGNPEAMFNLGNCYEYGRGVNKDLMQALSYYRQFYLHVNGTAKQDDIKKIFSEKSRFNLEEITKIENPILVTENILAAVEQPNEAKVNSLLGILTNPKMANILIMDQDCIDRIGSFLYDVIISRKFHENLSKEEQINFYYHTMYIIKNFPITSIFFPFVLDLQINLNKDYCEVIEYEEKVRLHENLKKVLENHFIQLELPGSNSSIPESKHSNYSPSFYVKEKTEEQKNDSIKLKKELTLIQKKLLGEKNLDLISLYKINELLLSEAKEYQFKPELNLNDKAEFGSFCFN